MIDFNLQSYFTLNNWNIQLRYVYEPLRTRKVPESTSKWFHGESDERVMQGR